MNKLTLTNKYETYSEYKNSGLEWLGDIPKKWNVTRSKFLFKHRKTRALPGDQQLTASQEDGVILQSEYMLKNGRQVVQVITGTDILKHVEPNDFVISMRSFQGGIEVSHCQGAISSAYVVLEPSDKVNPGYYSYLLKSKKYIQALQLTSNLVRDGQALRFQNFAQVDLPLVPLDEQEQIAKFLSGKVKFIDSIIGKKRIQIELLREKRSALIHHAVTKGLDPSVKLVESNLPWIGTVPATWELRPNKSFLKKRKKLVGGRHADFPLLSLTRQGVIVRDVESGKGKFSEDMSTFQVVEPGNLIFCLFDIKETPRTVGLSNAHGMITGAYTVFECSDPTLARFIEYFYIAMDDKKSLSYLYSGLRNTIAPPRFLRIPTPIPSREVQREIVDYLDKQTDLIAAMLEKIEKSIELLQEFKSSLISHAVTGKIRI